MTNEEFIESVRLEGEEWKGIVNYEGLYAISSFGRVISLGRYVRGRYSLSWKIPKLLTQTKMARTGYYCVRLSKHNDRGVLFLIHRLVADAFISNPNGYKCVDHIDTNRTNNNVDNLRWCSYKGNMENQNTRERLCNTPKLQKRKGLSRSVVCLKDDTCIKIYPYLSSVMSDNHDPKSVWLACNGQRIQHHGYKWMYLSDYEKLLSNSKSKNVPPNT